MNIKTKFNINDIAYILLRGKIIKCWITSITAEVIGDNTSPSIRYDIKTTHRTSSNYSEDEKYVYASIEELSESLLKEYRDTNLEQDE